MSERRTPTVLCWLILLAMTLSAAGNVSKIAAGTGGELFSGQIG
jgi:hypothetical protein